jgi:hypothetical protein
MDCPSFCGRAYLNGCIPSVLADNGVIIAQTQKHQIKSTKEQPSFAMPSSAMRAAGRNPTSVRPGLDHHTRSGAQSCSLALSNRDARQTAFLQFTRAVQAELGVQQQKLGTVYQAMCVQCVDVCERHGGKLCIGKQQCATA